MRDINDYEKQYLNDYDFEKYMVAYRRKNILNIMSKYPHKKILEIGCGMEPLFIYLDNVFEKYTVIEPSDTFYNNAKMLLSKRERERENIEIIHDFFDEKQSKILEQKYDYIIISGLLHEIEKPELFLKALLDICNQETRVYINVPNANSLHRILAKESGLISSVYEKSNRNRIMQQNHVFDMNTLIELITTSIPNAKIIEKGSYFIKPFSHKQMERCLSSNIFGEEVLSGFDNIIRYFPEHGAEIYVLFNIP